VNKYYVHLKKPSQEIENYEFISIENLENQLAETAVENIHIHDLLDYLDDNIFGVLQLIKSRLKRGGKLSLQGTDIRSLAASLVHGQISINTFKSMVYGINSDKRSCYSISEIKSILHDLDGLKIEKIQFLNASQYYIECYKYE